MFRKKMHTSCADDRFGSSKEDAVEKKFSALLNVQI